MTVKRWKAPPLIEGADSPVKTIDDRLLKQVLTINPSLRKGRSTGRVKLALERGDPEALPEAPPPDTSLADLEATVAYFVRGKSHELEGILTEIEERRLALQDAEARAREAMRRELTTFLGVLDREAIRQHGIGVLARHHDFLEALAVTPGQLVELIAKTNPSRRPR